MRMRVRAVCGSVFKGLRAEATAAVVAFVSAFRFCNILSNRKLQTNTHELRERSE